MTNDTRKEVRHLNDSLFVRRGRHNVGYLQRKLDVMGGRSHPLISESPAGKLQHKRPFAGERLRVIGEHNESLPQRFSPSIAEGVVGREDGIQFGFGQKRQPRFRLMTGEQDRRECQLMVSGNVRSICS